jgi:hypothetical protein
MKHREVTVTRPERQVAFHIVSRHLDAFVAGLTDSLVFGYLLHSEGECSAGYTVRGAVYYQEPEPEPEPDDPEPAAVELEVAA